MARSIKVTEGNKQVFDIKFDAQGTGDNPVKLLVTVDGATDNASFKVYSANGDWFSYEVERTYNDINKKDVVQIVLRVRRNLSTDVRLGTLVVEHNCADIKHYITLEQAGIIYLLEETSTNNNWVFQMTPKLPEEKILSFKATNGTETWYLKEIQQYQTLSDDNFNDLNEEYLGIGWNGKPYQWENDTQWAKMSQVRVPYDGAFKCRIEDGNFYIKSFGKVDLLPTDKSPHMRYFFIFSHSDVNNKNKGLLNDGENTYEIKKLFVFNKDDSTKTF